MEQSGMKAPMAIPLLGLCCGIVAADSIGVGLATSGVLIGGAIIIHLILLHLSRHPLRAYRVAPYHNVWLALLFAGIGMMSADLQRPMHLDADKLGSYSAARGRIVHISHLTQSDRAIVDAEQLIDTLGRICTTEHLKLLIDVEGTLLEADDEVTFPVKLRPIEDSPNFFTEGFARRMEQRGIRYRSECKSDQFRHSGHRPTLSGIAEHFRYCLESGLERSGLNKATRNFLITILLGDREYLDSEVRANFSDAGVSHVLALSGMHAAIIAMILAWILFPLNFLGLYRLRLMLTCLLLLGYAFISGMSPSTMRAALMCCGVAFATVLERKRSAWGILLMAVAFILLFDPYAIKDVGLHLSFLCVSALIFFVEPLNPISRHEHPRLYNACSMLLCTLVATGATWCVTAYHFGTLPVMFVAANLLILPLLPLYLTAAIGYLLLEAVGLQLTPVAFMLDHILEFIISSISELTNEGTTALHYTPSLLTLILWLATIAAGAYALHWRRNRMTLITAFTLGALSLATAFIIGDTHTEPDYIIQSFQGDYSILAKNGNKEETFRFRPHTSSRIRIKGHNIAFHDLKLTSDDIERLSAGDLLLLGGASTAEVAELDMLANSDKRILIVAHPKMRKARESALRTAADSLGLDFYSIREHGPYRATSGNDFMKEER